jgi:beta-xylosidase
MFRYCNPVYPEYFADPFVWEFQGTYYAVGTGPAQDETTAFPLLRSHNFIQWEKVGAALKVPPALRGGEFWAPEVAYDGKAFYLYYSASTEGLKHKLRVAKSEKPEGPYIDIGTVMKDPDQCPFAIDAHPFRDDDGSWWLFYARDFLDFDKEVRAGTALVVDRLIGMTELAGEEIVVARARYNWQLFKAQREMYGRVFDWHTLEGPCVRKKDGRYYCFYSGGCYENASYGVDYFVADNVTGPYHYEGSKHGPRVLKTIPARVIGPGHHSIVVGPDRQTEFVVYHAWDPQMTARRMCIDPLVWTESGPACLGPTYTAQPINIPARLNAA